MDPNSIPVYNIVDDNEVLAVEGCPSKGTDNVEDHDDLAELLEKDTIDDNESFWDILNRVRVDASYEDVLANVHETLTTPTTQTSGPSNVKEVNKVRVNSNPSNPKRRRKQGSSSMAFNEHMAMVGDTQKKMLFLLEGEVGSNTNGDQEKAFTFVESLAVLERMVGEDLLEEESDMWCFAVSILDVDEHRHVFMSLPKDSNRVVWIRYEYQTTHKIYKPLSNPGINL